MGVSVTILSGAAISDIGEFGAFRPSGIFIPAAWTPCDITFDFSPDGNNFGAADKYDGTTLSVITIPQAAITAGHTIAFVGDLAVAFTGPRAARVKTSVNQGGNRTLIFLLAPK